MTILERAKERQVELESCWFILYDSPLLDKMPKRLQTAAKNSLAALTVACDKRDSRKAERAELKRIGRLRVSDISEEADNQERAKRLPEIAKRINEEFDVVTLQEKS